MTTATHNSFDLAWNKYPRTIGLPNGQWTACDGRSCKRRPCIHAKHNGKVQGQCPCGPAWCA